MRGLVRRAKEDMSGDAEIARFTSSSVILTPVVREENTGTSTILRYDVEAGRVTCGESGPCVSRKNFFATDRMRAISLSDAM